MDMGVGGIGSGQWHELCEGCLRFIWGRFYELGPHQELVDPSIRGEMINGSTPILDRYGCERSVVRCGRWHMR